LRVEIHYRRSVAQNRLHPLREREAFEHGGDRLVGRPQVRGHRGDRRVVEGEGGTDGKVVTPAGLVDELELDVAAAIDIGDVQGVIPGERMWTAALLAGGENVVLDHDVRARGDGPRQIGC